MTIYIEALAGLVALVAILVVLYGPWQEVCTDYGRQIMFERRDTLFDMALEGRLGFASEEYRTLRRAMETLIRFAHEVTLARVLFLLLSVKVGGKKLPESPIVSALENVTDKETQLQVARLFGQAHLTILGMIVFKSPLLLLLLLASSPFVVVGITAAVALGRIRRWWAAVERGAQILGDTVQAEAESAPGAGVAC
ncbi:MAG: hypothetical protein JO002_12490 [Burkholderiaceae bacterium]|nr:hypothetical protein [Burkholderiaceae bacterium]